MRKLNLVDKRIGKLIVLEEEGGDIHGNIHWKCLCDCGNITTPTASSLYQGHTRSCGCLRAVAFKRRILPNGGAACRLTYNGYKHSAGEKNLLFELTFEDFKIITQKDCFYCGKSPQNECKRNSGSYRYSGLDRVDNTQGYTLGNLVPCCIDCNRMKRTMTQEEFRNHLLLILENWIV